MLQLQGLYVITDGSTGNALLEKSEQALRGGARLLQYRDKTTDTVRREQEAAELRALCREYDALLVINDDMILARRVAADGLHLGRHDAGLVAARTYLGSSVLLGVSCYNQLPLALKAQEMGADYVAFGSFFVSPTKPNAVQVPLALLQEASSCLSLPICAIGGITLEKAPLLLEQGADMLAVITDIFSSLEVEHRSAQYRLLWQGTMDHRVRSFQA